MKSEENFSGVKASRQLEASPAVLNTSDSSGPRYSTLPAPKPQMGWICPICNRAVAPWRDGCPYENQHVTPEAPAPLRCDRCKGTGWEVTSDPAYHLGDGISIGRIAKRCTNGCWQQRLING